MQPSMRTIVAALSDTHGGHKLGLMCPEVILFDETETGQLVPYQPKPTASQEYLWRLYQENVKAVIELANGDPVVAIHNGDIAQGNRFMAELVSTRMADQVLIGAANLRPWLGYNNVHALRLSVGTEAHVFGEGSAEILVADTLKREYPNKDIRVLHHGLAEVGGLMIDYAHHGPFYGSRTWLRGNVARYYLQSLMIDELMAGRRPADLYWRAHVHNWVRETVTVSIGELDYTSTILITPSYCMVGEHGHKVTRSVGSITNGMAAVEIVNGKLVEIHRLTKTMDIRTRERIE